MHIFGSCDNEQLHELCCACACCMQCVGRVMSVGSSIAVAGGQGGRHRFKSSMNHRPGALQSFVLTHKHKCVIVVAYRTAH